MKFLVPNYSCLQNPWLGATDPPDPRSLCRLPSTEFFEPSLTPKVQPRAELPGCNPAPNWNSKYKDFVAMMILIILHDLHFSQNQPLDMADD
jgi:hypothetical protein